MWVRLALAAACLAAAGGAAVAADRLDVGAGSVVPARTSAVVAVDLSNSIGSASFGRIAAVLGEIARRDEPVGLALFSDKAYEALPTRTQGRELEPFARLFQRVADSPAEARRRTPWYTFRGGTQVSDGLRLARAMLKREGVRNGSVLLISDLDLPSYDTQPVTDVLVAYRRERIPIRIVPINASGEDRAFFARVLGRKAFVERADLGRAADAERRPRLTATAPLALVSLAAVLALLLAANELWCARLVLRPADPR
jgi:hypothetical protein